MNTARLLAALVKLEHTVFALPFAYAGMVLGADAAKGTITVQLVLWITVAMFGARTLAMALNRVIDAELDARNPRTAMRELPRGAVSRLQVWVLCAVSLGLLVLATTQLDDRTLLLWPLPVALFVLYPYTKRFTWACHLVLGASIGLAPLAAWIAAGGPADDPVPYLMWGAIAAWIGGFDVIYATADVEFDRSAGVFSIPARFGVGRGLLAVRAMHTITVALLAAVIALAGLAWVSWVALALAAGLLAWENSIVRADDLSRIDHAFFTVNSWVGVVVGAGLVVGVVGG